MIFEEAYQQIRENHYKILDERESVSKSARLSLSTWILDILTECREADTPQTTSTPYCVDTSSVCKVDTPQTDCKGCDRYEDGGELCDMCALENGKKDAQTEKIKTPDYCDICNHNGCDNCIANNLDVYCVLSGYAPKDTPQTDCETCRHYKLACELFSEVCKYEPTTQTETQNSNLTFDTPQTELTAKCLNCHNAKACKEKHWDGCIYEPQTDCEDIYPLVIIEDRYTGVYSNGEYTAWNMYFDEIPQDIDGDDVSCYDFWHSYDGIVGLGRTPNEAIEDLRKKLDAERNEK